MIKISDPSTWPPWPPDWRDSAQYPRAPQPASIWRWEFLRRSQSYQSDWQRIGPKKWARDWWSNRAWEHFRAKFGILELRPPTFPSALVSQMAFEEDDDFFEEVWPEDGRGRNVRRVRVDDYQVPVIYDLRRALEPQLENAAIALRRGQSFLVKVRRIEAPKKRRLQPKKFQSYLMLLDAESAKATRREMCKIFGNKHSAEDLVDDGLTVAHELRDGDYRLIRSRKQKN